MEPMIVCLKIHKIRVPKFILWEIMRFANLELNYSLELARHFYPNKRDFKYRAIVTRSKFAYLFVDDFSIFQLKRLEKTILASNNGYAVRVLCEKLCEDDFVTISRIFQTGDWDEICKYKCHDGPGRQHPRDGRSQFASAFVRKLIRESHHAIAEYLFDAGLVQKPEALLAEPTCTFIEKIVRASVQFGLFYGVTSGSLAHVKLLVSLGCCDYFDGYQHTSPKHADIAEYMKGLYDSN